MKKVICIILAFVCAFALMIGCAPKWNTPNENPTNPTDTENPSEPTDPTDPSDTDPTKPEEPEEPEIKDGYYELLQEAPKPEPYDYKTQNEQRKMMTESVNKFSAQLGANIFKGAFEAEENQVFSPLSVYLALALCVECTDGETRQEILNAFDITYEELVNGAKVLIGALSHDANDKDGHILNITESIWLDKEFNYKPNILEKLSETLLASAHKVDFADEIAFANKKISDFVYENTNHFLRCNLNIPPEMLFVLINTLYLKDAWGYDDLEYTDKEYDFKLLDGSTKKTKLLKDWGSRGQAIEKENYSYMYAETYNGFKLKFIVPKGNAKLADVFNEQTINEVNGIKDFNFRDEEKKEVYYTNCYFPAFSAQTKVENLGSFVSALGINKLFGDADFSPITDGIAFVSHFAQVARLVVDEKGIEGAAVTAISAGGSAEQFRTVYRQFIVDRAFGYIITDSSDTILFTGAVNNI